jgi:glutamyl-tRNA synthetase
VTEPLTTELAEALPAHLREALFAAQQQRSRQRRSRYAPTPSGPLHLGNLRTALLSWLQARLSGAQWLLRIDDLDTPRIRPGAELQALEDLRWLGLDWDGPLLRQSERRGLYHSVLSALRRCGLLYPCHCSRRMLADVSAPHGAWPLYPGTCRGLAPDWCARQGRWPSWRLRLEPGPLPWRELGAGPGRLDAVTEVGDVVLRRADGFLGYHLATAVDELWLGITTVVRGEDLSVSTGPQVALMQLLGCPPPQYWHVPLLLDERGTRLAKREGAAGLQGWRAMGGDAPSLIGHWAAQFGWVPEGSRLSAAELLQQLKGVDAEQGKLSIPKQ